MLLRSNAEGAVRVESRGEVLNQFLVEVFGQILKAEAACLAGKDLSLRELHLIDAVCRAVDQGGDNRSTAIAAALGAMAALRCGLRALDGKRDLAVRCNGKHFDLHSLPIAQHGRKILHELIRNLRNMDKTRLALGQRNKCAERLDAGDLPLDNIPNL